MTDSIDSRADSSGNAGGGGRRPCRLPSGRPVTVAGYPLAEAYPLMDGRWLIVLARSVRWTSIDCLDLLVCPWCSDCTAEAATRSWAAHVRGSGYKTPKRPVPSCGCRKGAKAIWRTYREAGGTSHFKTDRAVSNKLFRPRRDRGQTGRGGDRGGAGLGAV